MWNVKKLIKQLQRQYSNGAPDFRVEKAREAFDIIKQFRIRLQNSLFHQEEEYTQTREAWASTRINGRLRPEEVEHQVRDGMMFNVVAWILTVAELVTFWFLASNFGVNPYFFLVLALVLTTALKAALIAIWNSSSQPIEAIRRIRQYIIWPSLVLMLLAGAVLLFGRVADGDLASTIASCFSIAVFALSLSCMGLAAGLFATAYLLLWSRRAVKKYCNTEQNLVVILREGRKVVEIIRKLDRENENPTTSKWTRHADFVTRPLAKIAGVTAPIVVLCFAVLMSGCQDKTNAPTQSNLTTRTTSLHLICDWSFSAEPVSMNEFAQKFTKELPEVSEKYGLTNYEISRFGDDGWDPVKIKNVNLPSLQHADKSEVGEVIGNIRQAQDKKLLDRYRAQLSERLSQVSASYLIPPSDFPQPPCTDLNGVFKRTVVPHNDDFRIFVVVTDGHESCGHDLRSVKAPSSNTVLLVVLLPEKVGRNVSRLKYEQFEQRSNEIAKAIPWAVIVPPFNGLSTAIDTAIAKTRVAPAAKNLTVAQTASIGDR